jgi:hypothetical protein
MTLAKTTAINKIQMLVAHGASDTKKHSSGATYGGISLREISQMVAKPQAVEKRDASFIIASDYREQDGREHAAQRERGNFWMLCVDVDHGSPELADVLSAVREVCGDAAMLAYSSASSSEQQRKWRVLIPLATPISGQLYIRMQLALFEALAMFGITADHALARSGQPVFLPNVPPHLRVDGEPIFYEFAREAGSGFFEATKSVLQERVDAILQWEKQTEEHAAAERTKRMAERAERALRHPEQRNPVDVFNEAHSVSDLLLKYGYERAGSSAQYKSRYQSSGSYATKDYGDHWVSLSGSDAAAGVGSAKSIGSMSYAWGDAFDLFVHFEHGGDFKAAVRAYGEEINPRAADPFKDTPLPASSEPEDAGLDDFKATTPAAAPAPALKLDDIEIPDSKPVILGLTWPTPYNFWDSALLSPRQWIYATHYLRSFVSVLASAGGIGKTSLQIVEALAICTGRPLLGEVIHERCKVYIVNLEDPIEEMQRRVLAAMKYYGIKREEVDGWLFLDAGRDFQMKFTAQTRDGTLINEALIKRMEQKIIENDIGLTFIDPWVGANDINENDNGQMNTAVAQVRRIADKTNSAFGLVHHIRKTGGEDATIDSVRGAGSLIGAARAARVINRISVEDAIAMGISEKDATGLFRVDDGKANLAPPAAHSVYRRVVSTKIDNGEWVGVVTEFKMPDAFDGVTARHAMTVQKMVGNADDPCRENPQAKNWVGLIVAEVLDLDLDKADEKARCKSIIRKWIDTDVLRREMLPDKRNGRDAPSIVVGVWITGDEAGY